MKKKPWLYNSDSQTKMVQEIFSSISVRYDFLNHLLSFGQDVFWRKKTVQNMHFFSTYKCIDIATGTGDIALEIASQHPEVHITGVDFSKEMISIAEQKSSKKRKQNPIHFQWGDATCLPFPDNSFDVAVIAFGIRNIPHKHKALSEMKRVVIPGGQVMVLEMVSQQNRYFQSLYQFYLCYGLPFIAHLFSKNRNAYEYLSHSILHFPTESAFHKMIQDTGLSLQHSIPMALGITRLFIAHK